jgi:catechol 2,3-dioxygenase-like lactoylglutathione lyase family enzyme
MRRASRAEEPVAPVSPLVSALDQGPTRDSTGARDRSRRDGGGDTDPLLEVSMSTDVGSAGSAENQELSTIDMALEVVTLPVSDVDRAKAFYQDLGWRFDIDLVVSDAVRTVQFTPPHSPCSIQFGKGGTTADPGSAQKTFLVVSDIDAARADLVGRGVDVSEVQAARPPGFDGPEEERSYFARAEFSDPDGNTWVLQEITTRLPGRTWED